MNGIFSYRYTKLKIMLLKRGNKMQVSFEIASKTAFGCNVCLCTIFNHKNTITRLLYCICRQSFTTDLQHCSTRTIVKGKFFFASCQNQRVMPILCKLIDFHYRSNSTNTEHYLFLLYMHNELI